VLADEVISDSEHFIDADNIVHTHTEKCILCGGSGGDSVLEVAFERVSGGIGLIYWNLHTRLCDGCATKHLPLTRLMRRKLDRLSDRVWKQMMKRGCPCCCGIEWHPGAADARARRRQRRWSHWAA
jgi:hypothetical protein